MPATQAVVTLYPLSTSDDFPYRSLDFTPEINHVNIGRASKRESKNLIPAKNNGLFDSRVMSRNHAKLWLVYIRDGGSMHGTWINENKISSEEGTVIQHGDVVTFGSTVFRGRETYPPLRVRCEFEWPDPLYVPCDPPRLKSAHTMNRHRHVPASNTFCVPDDDESDGKQDSIPMVIASGSASEDDNSTSCSDSDDQSVVEVSSPLTSPLKKDDGENCLITTYSDIKSGDKQVGGEGSQQSPIDLDGEKQEQPLVTPRMTPPSVIDIIEDPSNMVHQFSDFIQEADTMSVVDSDDDSDEEEEEEVEDSTWEEDDHADLNDDLDSQSSFRSNAGQSYDDEESVRSNSPHVLGICDLIVPETGFAVDEPNNRLNSGANESHSENYASIGESLACQAGPYGPGLLAMGNTTPAPHSQSMRPSGLTSTGAPLPSILLQPTLSPQNTKALDRPTLSFHNTPSVLPIDWWHPRNTTSTAYPLHTPPTPQVPYEDGPFVNNESIMLGDTAPACKASIESVAAPTAAAVGKNERASPNGGQEIQKETAMALQQQDISSTSLPQTTSPEQGSIAVQEKRPLKRKAEDIDGPSPSSELDTAAYHRDPVGSGVSNDTQSSGCSYEESCFPDAQPHTPVSKLEVPSQLTVLDTAKELPMVDSATIDADMTEHPSKRAKKSTAGGFASHAATAALGVAIGAFGTIAALASLPPDYFQ
ncbi:FHA domain protein [Aspergillus sclerotioniger CBS 115572]|uniref:FHA domain protein n=1 Tax=Aspergillus sclerotioniger CBS 115572 TaxID=1450535 RepID=A0A317WYE7_9EURO|nr:FHA domain protein [Aspergillus sclerotioniger CBS 115572]PWY91379.1 FHA domain protein [Aspergillus sclerotioniger CBS 115572]